jgi:hypothetical protein
MWREHGGRKTSGQWLTSRLRAALSAIRSVQNQGEHKIDPGGKVTLLSGPRQTDT